MHITTAFYYIQVERTSHEPQPYKQIIQRSLPPPPFPEGVERKELSRDGRTDDGEDEEAD